MINILFITLFPLVQIASLKAPPVAPASFPQPLNQNTTVQHTTPRTTRTQSLPHHLTTQQVLRQSPASSPHHRPRHKV